MNNRHCTRYGDSIWFIIAERDIDSPFKASGAIIMEQYTNQDTDSVRERAQSFANSGRYGRVWMASVDEKDCAEVKPTEEDGNHNGKPLEGQE